MLSCTILPFFYGFSLTKKSVYEKYDISNRGNHLVIVHDEEEQKVIKKIQLELNVSVAQQTYYLFSNQKTVKKLLILVLGPLSKFQLDIVSKTFIEIIESKILAYKIKKVISRSYPRLPKNLKTKLLKYSNKNFSNFHSHNHEESLIDTVTDRFCAIGSSLKALRVGKAFE